MTSIPFDTLDAPSTLCAAGLEENVAKASVEVVKRTADLPDTSVFAQKADVPVLRADIERLDKRIDDLHKLIFASMAINLTGFLAVGGSLYAVLK